MFEFYIIVTYLKIIICLALWKLTSNFLTIRYYIEIVFFGIVCSTPKKTTAKINTELEKFIL